LCTLGSKIFHQVKASGSMNHRVFRGVHGVAMA
jgi:hypothetical protein